MSEVSRGLLPGLLYGLLAFLAGAVLGPIRELVLAPVIGGLQAALIEGAVMAVALFLVARLAARRLPPHAGREPRAGMAAMGLMVVLAAEAALGAALDASGLSAERAVRSGAEQAVGLVLLGWLAVLPFRVRREG
ncbi:hypothetical protein [Roseicella aerolata]|uniref:Uncharacterized protein n=1 Tax=Roseicella aerolata TaxID=2883479 RepID=A0A9X1ICQ4_9PROT|nr:hypothetical protein [Roseicella aerolata]MCB4822002.1 hypothetical protein [Roseicella aerolata]